MTNMIYRCISKRGIFFVEYALILAFIVCIGVFFTPDSSFIKSVEDVLYQTVFEISCKDAEQNVPETPKPNPPSSGGSSDSSDTGNAGDSGGTDNNNSTGHELAYWPDSNSTSFLVNGMSTSLNDYGMKVKDTIWSSLSGVGGDVQHIMNTHDRNNSASVITYDADGNVTVTFNDGTVVNGNVTNPDYDHLQAFRKQWAAGASGTYVFDSQGHLVQNNGDFYSSFTIGQTQYGYK